MNDRDFLNWIADRFQFKYGESPNVDFVQRLREIANYGVFDDVEDPFLDEEFAVS